VTDRPKSPDESEIDQGWDTPKPAKAPVSLPPPPTTEIDDAWDAAVPKPKPVAKPVAKPAVVEALPLKPKKYREKPRPVPKTEEQLEAKAAKKAAKKEARRAERKALAEAGNRPPRMRPKREGGAQPLADGSYDTPAKAPAEPFYMNPIWYVLVAAAIVLIVAWRIWQRGW
jgi:hypothetical protein